MGQGGISGDILRTLLDLEESSPPAALCHYHVRFIRCPDHFGLGQNISLVGCPDQPGRDVLFPWLHEALHSGHGGCLDPGRSAVDRKAPKERVLPGQRVAQRTH